MEGDNQSCKKRSVSAVIPSLIFTIELANGTRSKLMDSTLSETMHFVSLSIQFSFGRRLKADYRLCQQKMLYSLASRSKQLSTTSTG